MLNLAQNESSSKGLYSDLRVAAIENVFKKVVPFIYAHIEMGIMIPQRPILRDPITQS